MGRHAKHCKDCGRSKADSNHSLPNTSFGQSREHSGKGHYADMAAAKVEGVGEIGKEVMAQQLLTAAHRYDGKVYKTQNGPDNGKWPLPLPAYKIRYGAEKICPANLAEDPPPQPFKIMPVRCAVNQRQDSKNRNACRLETNR